MLSEFVMQIRVKGYHPDINVTAASGPGFGQCEAWFVDQAHGYIAEFSNAALIWHSWLQSVPSDPRELLCLGHENVFDRILERAHVFGPNSLPKPVDGEVYVLASVNRRHALASDTRGEPLRFDRSRDAAGWIRRACVGPTYRIIGGAI